MIIQFQKGQTKCKCFVCNKFINKGEFIALVPKNNGSLWIVHKDCAEEVEL